MVEVSICHAVCEMDCEARPSVRVEVGVLVGVSLCDTDCGEDTTDLTGVLDDVDVWLWEQLEENELARDECKLVALVGDSVSDDVELLLDASGTCELVGVGVVDGVALCDAD